VFLRRDPLSLCWGHPMSLGGYLFQRKDTDFGGKTLHLGLKIGGGAGGRMRSWVETIDCTRGPSARIVEGLEDEVHRM
jgi:hypothetical protein